MGGDPGEGQEDVPQQPPGQHPHQDQHEHGIHPAGNEVLMSVCTVCMSTKESFSTKTEK